MVCFLGTAAIVLPPLMVERNVLVSNLMSFWDAAASVISWASSEGSNAQNAPSYVEEGMKAQAGRREAHRACGQDCDWLDLIMISSLVSKVNLFQPAVVSQSDLV